MFISYNTRFLIFSRKLLHIDKNECSLLASVRLLCVCEWLVWCVCFFFLGCSARVFDAKSIVVRRSICDRNVSLNQSSVRNVPTLFDQHDRARCSWPRPCTLCWSKLPLQKKKKYDQVLNICLCSSEIFNVEI